MWILLALLALQCQSSPAKVTLAGGSLAGAWSAISEGLVSCLRREMPELAVTNEPGLDGANAVLVDEGRVELGMVHAAMARLAVQGRYPYQKRLTRLQGISLVYSDSAFHFLINRRLGLNSIEEIREKRFPLRLSVIYRGSLMEIASRTVLEAYGMSYEEIESWGGKIYFRALRPSLELMQDGRLDAVSVTVQFPQTQINEAALSQDLSLLPLSQEAIHYVNSRLGTYPSEIPAGTYSFAPNPVPTFSDVVILIAHAGLPEELAYRIARAIHRNLDYLHHVHRALARLPAEELPRVPYLPLHPGARRFYREMGLLD